MIEAFLTKILKVGDITVRLADGIARTYGDGTGAPVAVRISGKAARAIATNPELALGEAYMDGGFVIERGDIWDLMVVVGRNQVHADPAFSGVLGEIILQVRRKIEQFNDRDASKRNVAHHYDISNDLYRRFLDADLQYSCAYFPRPGMTLEEAQAAKKAHIAAKLKLEPGMRVLDIGCGWGGMALELGGRYGVEVLGVTLSEQQLSLAQERAQHAGLGDRVRFSLTDYRDLQGPFDRIVSVGMFEHVGVPGYLEFFGKIRDLLTDDGVALVHSIGRGGPPSLTNPWTRKYIFPGGYIPSLSETVAAIERTGLWITDVEILRLHYAETLKCWRERFNVERPALAAEYDERFCRMWEFYLASAELAFRFGDQMNFQIQLSRKVDALPVSRDYMIDDERAGPQAVREAAE